MNDNSHNKSVSRKDFLRTAGSTALFATLGIGFFGCSSKVTGNEPDEAKEPGEAIQVEGNSITINLEQPEVAGLRSAGGWLLINQANTLVVNVDGDVIRAFTSVCTHAQCSDSWDFNNNEFICNCHLSKFDTSGRVTKGPATQDLEEYSVTRDVNIVTIVK
ncbi:MAG: Rieske (2Fe-2S) protein [Gracilimonas sp.]|uniref:Rieske (2Fe-2S) protein n=1 Tax=Gracilimonas sp. TaxID=1974203 RepID=UPI00198FA970|nr:Rieske (2Fe-2S) protein [Gracilimonas sp.]MBD3617032.1 Rieske (2Fe-2S) protein [Gracilimonas sp.]